MSDAPQYKPRTDASSTTIVGRVGSEKSIRFSQGNGKAAVLRFSVAVAEAVGKADNLREETAWYNVVVFGGQAENLHKLDLAGSRVAIVGRMRPARGRRVKLVEDESVEFTPNELELIPLVRGGVELLGRPASSNGTSTASVEPTPSAEGENIPF